MTPLRPLSQSNSFRLRQWITAIALLTATLASGQQIGDSTYWVYFTDKADNGYSYEEAGEGRGFE